MTKPDAGPRPTLRDRLLAYLGFGLVFVVVYGGADLISSRYTTRYDVAVWLDRAIPYMPSFALAYLLINLTLALPALCLANSARLWAFYATLCVEVVIAGLFFILLPVAAMPQTEAPQFDGANLAMRLADHMNLSWNYFPSLHVALAISCAIVLQRLLKRYASLAL